MIHRGVWILRTDATDATSDRNPEDLDENPTEVSLSSEVEIGFMGLFGAHTFHDDR